MKMIELKAGEKFRFTEDGVLGVYMGQAPDKKSMCWWEKTPMGYWITNMGFTDTDSPDMEVERLEDDLKGLAGREA